MKTQSLPPACHYVGKVPELLALVKSFAGRSELNGHWDEEGTTYWGTKPAVSLVRAFVDGYYGCLSSVNPSRKL